MCLASGLVHFRKGRWRRPELGPAAREKRRARPCSQEAQSCAGEERQGLYTNTTQAELAISLMVPKHVCLFLALYLSLKKKNYLKTSLLHVCDSVFQINYEPPEGRHCLLLTAIPGTGPGTVEASGEYLQK